MISLEQRTHAIEQDLSLSHLSYLWHFFNALDSFSSQIGRQLAAHGSVCTIGVFCARSRDQTHLPRLFEQVFVLRLQNLELGGESLCSAHPSLLSLLDLISPSAELLTSLDVLQFDRPNSAREGLLTDVCLCWNVQQQRD